MHRFAALLLFWTSLVAIAAEPMNYKYWDFGASKKRDDYQFALLRIALEKTIPTYGPFELTKVETQFTTHRASREVSRGEILNIEATPHKPAVTPEEIKERGLKISIPIPIMNGLLGYRQLIVRKEDLEKFSTIQCADDLRKFTAGQGKNWEDISIYRSNNFKVDDEAEYQNLLTMLVAKRFDYLPLSTMETDGFLQQFPKNRNDVAVVPNLFIYYPFPVLFTLSIHHPKLAERVKEGLLIAKKDGSMQLLFEKTFSEELKNLKTKNAKVVVLKNPNLTNDLGMASPKLLLNPKVMNAN